MAHEISASGYGYSWPTIVFSSDGDTIEVVSRASGQDSIQSVRYQGDASESVPGQVFEDSLDDFMDLVVSRLDNIGIKDSVLQHLWADILAERRDPEATHYRRVEAQLGYDPGEAAEKVISKFLSAAIEIGEDAVSEVAPTCEGLDPSQAFDKIVEMTKQPGIQAHAVSLSPSVLPLPDTVLPWDRGYALADSARTFFNIDPGPIPDRILADLFQVSPEIFTTTTSASAPIGLATRNVDREYLTLFFKRTLYESRRFELTRMLAESLTAPAMDSWFPITEFRTARQKFQRSFAAEMLCPIESLRQFMDSDFSEERINEAGKHFMVSPLIIEHQIGNRLAMAY